MCTAVVSIDPHSPMPVLLIGVRDEFLDRAWLEPGRHWSQNPALLGGKDLQAGGTWLAVDPAVPRAACVLNGHGEMAGERARLSRGALPLKLAADGEFDDIDPARYDPFHLLCATPESTRLWSWDGEKLAERSLGPGLHLIVNSGLAGTDGYDGPGAEQMQARVEHFRPLLEKARRPTPRTGSAPAAWGEWLPLADGGGLDPANPDALVVRRDLDDGRQWGTSSVSLVALGPGSVRYDFCALPGTAGAWSTVLAAG
jgi:hypothetical protein